MVSDGDTALGLSLTLSDEGRFTLTSADGRVVEGRYVLWDTELPLNDATGSLGNASFPMTCPISQSGAGFAVGQAEGCRLEGLQFNRVF